MKEIWNQPLSTFEKEIKKVNEVTGESFELSDENREQTLEQFLKTDKARLRAFLSVLKKTNEKTTDEKIEKDFSKEVKTLRVLDAVDGFVKKYEDGEYSTLEPRQVESLTKIAAFLRSGKTRGYLELPTGLGKTVIFSEFIEAVKDVHGVRILVVGSGNVNAIQNMQKIEMFGNEQTGQYFAGKKDTDAKVTVCNYHGLRAGIEEGHFKNGDFDMILLDEVHDGLGTITQQLIQGTFTDETMIGFSATATYELSKGKKVTSFLPVEIDKMGVVEAVRENLLAGFKVEIVKIPTEVSEVRVSRGDYLPGELEKQINTRERNGLVVDSYAQFYRKEGNKVVAFCVGIKHTNDLAAMFNEKGIKAGVLTSELTTLDEREAVLQKWKNGEIEVLCGSKLAWQALDETEANVGLNVTPSMSEKDVVQRGGRLLRRSQRRNNKKSTIVEFFDEWREVGNRPIFYSEILDTAEAEPDKWKTEPATPSVESVVSQAPAEEIELEDSGSGAADSEPQIKGKVKKKKITRYTNAEEIMSISNQNRRFRNEGYLEYAPKQWMSANIIAVELGVTTREVESALTAVAREISVRQLTTNSGVYLSALGIKRIFFGPKVVDLIYKRFTGSTRAENISSGVVTNVSDFAEIEQRSVKLESKESSSEKVDLEWRDYDLLPSFTLAGESLDDEMEGTNINDVSELHPKGEPIDGPINDVIGYRYKKVADGVVLSGHKAPVNRPHQEALLKATYRYGIRLKEDFLGDTGDEFGDIVDDNEQRAIVDLILSKNILDAREMFVINWLYLHNDYHQNTLESIGKKVGVTRERIRGIANEAIGKMRYALHMFEKHGKVTLKPLES